MADMDIKTTKSGRRGRHPIKVDLTAMVDLGFLLITFFMLATTMTNSKSMLVNKMEDDIDINVTIPASKTMTLLLGNNDKAYYYTSEDNPKSINDFVIDSVDFSSKGLRRAIINRQNEVAKKYGESHRKDLFVMIKPLPKSTLKNTVDAFDEMTITGVNRYVLLTPKEPVDSIVAKMIGQVF